MKNQDSIIRELYLLKMKKVSIALILIVFYFVSCDNRLDWLSKKNNPTTPTVTSISPTFGNIGTVVTITGTNFSMVAVNDKVTFNGVSAQVTAATTTQLTVSAPATGSTGPVSVTVGNLSAVNQPIFTYGDPTLIGNYLFNGDAIDQSIYKNNGTITSATLTKNRFNKENSAYQFNDAYIQIPAQNASQFKSNQLTIVAWINPTILGTYVVNQAKPDGSPGPLSLDIFDGTIRTLIYSSNKPNYIQLDGTTIIQKNVWQHIAVTWDGNTVSLYYNGVQDGSGNFNQPFDSTDAGDIYIGAYKWVFPTASFQGALDDVKIYNRALTSAEIKDLYNKTE